MTIQDAVEHLERAAEAEAVAKQALEQAENGIGTGNVTRGDLADRYEEWLSAMGDKQRAELALARLHAVAA